MFVTSKRISVTVGSSRFADVAVIVTCWFSKHSIGGGIVASFYFVGEDVNSSGCGSVGVSTSTTTFSCADCGGPSSSNSGSGSLVRDSSVTSGGVSSIRSSGHGIDAGAGMSKPKSISMSVVGDVILGSVVSPTPSQSSSSSGRITFPSYVPNPVQEVDAVAGHLRGWSCFFGCRFRKGLLASRNG
jgi:hypothetical protein